MTGTVDAVAFRGLARAHSRAGSVAAVVAVDGSFPCGQAATTTPTTAATIPMHLAVRMTPSCYHLHGLTGLKQTA